MHGPLCNQTDNLKTDSKTLYYSMLKLKYSPSIFKHNKGYKKYALLNNSHNNCHRNYTNGIFLHYTHFQINCSLHPTGSCHVLFCVFGDFYASGTQDVEVTKSLGFSYWSPICFKSWQNSQHFVTPPDWFAHEMIS